MSFRQDCIDELPDLIFNEAEGAVEAYYNDATTPILVYPTSGDPTLQDPEAAGETLNILIMASDIAKPANGDRLTIGSTLWRVLRLSGVADVSGFWRLLLTTSTRRRL